MSEVTQLTSATVVIIFAAVMLVAGQLYIESRENKSVRIPTTPAVQIASIPFDDPAADLNSICHRDGASITLQLVRPVIRQSCILLLAVNS